MDSLGRRQGSLDRLIGILVFVWDLGHQCRRVGEAGGGGGGGMLSHRWLRGGCFRVTF